MTLICVICVDFKPHSKKESSIGNYDKFNAEAVCNIGSPNHDPHKAEPLLTECLSRASAQSWLQPHMTENKTDAESAQRSLWVQASMVTMPPQKLVTKTRTQKRQTLLCMDKIQERQTVLRGHLRERDIWIIICKYCIYSYIYIYIRSPCLELISIRCRYSIGFSLNTCLKHFHSMYREILYIFLQGSNGDLSRSFEC